MKLRLKILFQPSLVKSLYLDMKFFVSLFLCVLVFSCKAKQSNLITEKQEFNSSSYCPDNGVCSIELIPNSTLDQKKGALGELYVSVKEGENLVFKFSYKKNVPEGVMDAHYIEEVYAELDSNFSDINIKGKELSKVKFMYNRICYCKGQTGFYKINNGNLFVKKIDAKTYNIQFESSVEEVPQIVTRINETFILD
jgi:hypothetical protein